MAGEGGHSRSGGSGDSRGGPAPGPSTSSSYSSWYQTGPGWSSASLGRLTGGSLAGSSLAPGASARAELTRLIRPRPRATWWIGLLLALGFAAVVTPAITAEHWLPAVGVGPVTAGAPAPITVRVPAFAGVQAAARRIGGGGVIVVRGEVASAAQAEAAALAEEARPRGALPYAAAFGGAFALAALFTRALQRSARGRLLRVQLVSLAVVAALALAAKALMLATAVSILAVPVALLAIAPAMALDRAVGLATGALAALIASLLVPFDAAIALVLLAQAAAAGLIVAEAPRRRWRAAVVAGGAAAAIAAAALLAVAYLARGSGAGPRELAAAPWLAAVSGPAIAAVLAAPLLPLYQRLVGEVTDGQLVRLADHAHPLLRQIADRAPGTWQHSLMVANLAEIAANEIGASGRLVRVGAYFHDLGKSLQPKYFVENLEPGETSPHDQLPPEVSCEAIFAHVAEGIATARKAGLPEQIIDFMHMHHGSAVLEYFWDRAQQQGNPRGLSIDHFRYPGIPPQSRETALLSICDAVEAAARTLRRPEPAEIDALVERIIQGKLQQGQLDASGLAVGDLRRVGEALSAAIRHANHGRIEYPWQKPREDASASASQGGAETSGPRTVSGHPGAGATSGGTGARTVNERPGPGSLALERTQRAEAPQRAPLPPAQIVDDDEAAAASARRAPPLPPPPDDDDEDLGLVQTAPQTPTGPGQTAAGMGPIAAAPAATAAGHRQTAAGPGPVAAASAPMTAAAQVQAMAAAAPASVAQVQAMAAAAAAPASAEPAWADPAWATARVQGLADPAWAAAPRSAEPQALTAVGESTQVGLAPAPAPEPRGAPAPELDPRATQHGRPHRSDAGLAAAQGGARTQGTQLGFGHPPAPPAPQWPPAPSAEPDERPSFTDEVATPVMPAMIGELGRAESRADIGEPPPDDPPSDDAPPVPAIPTTMPGHRAPAHLPAHAGAGDRRGRSPIEDASSTEPSMPRFELPAQPPGGAAGPWSSGLAARIDAALHDEWSNETPVVPPSRAALQALLGAPDPTRQQSLAELEALHRAAEELYSEPGLAPPPPPARRAPPPPTTEVDPDQIEAAIELAPPARRAPHAIGGTKPKKPA